MMITFSNYCWSVMISLTMVKWKADVCPHLCLSRKLTACLSASVVSDATQTVVRFCIADLAVQVSTWITEEMLLTRFCDF